MRKQATKNALAALREGRGGTKRSEQYSVAEAEPLLEEVSEEEISDTGDFVVDDGGYADTYEETPRGLVEISRYSRPFQDPRDPARAQKLQPVDFRQRVALGQPPQPAAAAQGNGAGAEAPGEVPAGFRGVTFFQENSGGQKSVGSGEASPPETGRGKN